MYSLGAAPLAMSVSRRKCDSMVPRWLEEVAGGGHLSHGRVSFAGAQVSSGKGGMEVGMAGGAWEVEQDFSGNAWGEGHIQLLL